MSEVAPVLAPHRARTFYNLCDALRPPGDDPARPYVDPAPALRAALQRRGDARAVLRWLRGLEWESWLRHRRSFSWLPRAGRRALVERWAASPFPPRRRAGRALLALVAALPPLEPAAAAPQSADGA